MNYVIGLDLGGTNIKGIVMNSEGEIIKQHYIPTKDTVDGSWRNNVKEMVIELKSSVNQPITVIGMSAPGLPDEKNQCISFLPNRLIGLENFIWSDFLENQTFVINDAHSALMAEHSFGVAQGRKNVVLLTLGTGVGGGILINGNLYQGLSQMAGHLGHITVDADNQELSIVGMAGSLEFAIGNYSIEKRSHGKFTSTWELIEAHRKGDYWATLVWLTSVKKLAVAIASLSNALSPECVVLSGGITNAAETLFEPLNAYLDLFEWRPGGKKTEILQAKFGDMAGAIGAASFALRKFNEKD